MLLVADDTNIFELTGNGDVLEPEQGVMGNFSLSFMLPYFLLSYSLSYFILSYILTFFSFFLFFSLTSCF